ncbi:hypothetical protein HDU97_008692 [Phlyctochytrium planicorne]|nr:hypothetical protein HDU97_008692 [Phlyctochytrium planicorne]
MIALQDAQPSPNYFPSPKLSRPPRPASAFPLTTSLNSKGSQWGCNIEQYYAVHKRLRHSASLQLPCEGKMDRVPKPQPPMGASKVAAKSPVFSGEPDMDEAIFIISGGMGMDGLDECSPLDEGFVPTSFLRRTTSCSAISLSDTGSVTDGKGQAGAIPMAPLVQIPRPQRHSGKCRSDSISSQTTLVSDAHPHESGKRHCRGLVIAMASPPASPVKTEVDPGECEKLTVAEGVPALISPIPRKPLAKPRFSLAQKDRLVGFDSYLQVPSQKKASLDAACAELFDIIHSPAGSPGPDDDFAYPWRR